MRRQSNTQQDFRGARAVTRPTVAAIHRLARRQQGLVTRRQLIDLGVEPRKIDRRIEARRLVRVRRCVYRVGPIAQALEPEMAATLAVGEHAVLSHHSAAFLHTLLPYPDKDGFVHVTLSARQAAPKPGIRIHRTAHLPPDEVTRRQRIPVTTPARTLVDLAAELTAGELEQAVAQAHRKRLATPQSLRTLIARYPRRPGVPALRAMLDGETTPAFTRSGAERRLLTLVRRAGLGEPQVNAMLCGYEVDFLWPEHRLVVEVDGPTFHSTRPDRRRDQARDAELALTGFTVIRLDPDEVAQRPEATAALLARATR